MLGGALIKKYHDKYNDDSEINNEKGAKLLATGSSSCVFHPSIPCKDSKGKPTNDKISKIVYGKKSNRYMRQEKKINKMIKKIKDYSDWALIYDEFCKAPLYSNILKNYDKKIVDCMDKYYEERFNKTNNMMIGLYGGDTFDDYFIDNIFKKSRIDKSIYKLLCKMEPLFYGLEQLKEHKISHLDIKVNNIVLHNDVFKYIDFGLSSEFSDIDHFKTRSLSELNNKRFYLWYPLEYIYCHLSKSDEKYELSRISKRKHYDKGIQIYKLLGYDFDKIAEKCIKNKVSNYKDLYSLIDVFSLGVMIPYLFIDYNLIKHIKKSVFLTDLFNLFSRMCHPEYDKRIKPDECLELYNSLISKYSSLKSGSKKNKKLTKKK
jgi:serine/threonine protein kinase|tara:strand:- start:1300 stop:2424 length:1125 start_codon:yes stop_codon:yes gene_type:complete